MTDHRLHFNGINGASGRPLVPSMTSAELVDWVAGSERLQEPENRQALEALRAQDQQKRHLLGTRHGIDPLDIDAAGWGVVYHPDTPAAVKEALARLVDRRRGRQLEYQPGERWSRFRSRHGQGPGDVDPETLPYYLLIVGSPEEIPFELQYGLDIDHAVGRLHFDTAAEYRCYAERLLAFEATASRRRRQRRLALLATRHPDDDSTLLSTTRLVQPLANELGRSAGGHTIEHLVDRQAGKQAILELLRRDPDDRPSLVFTATHGVGYPCGDPEQLERQGALVTQDWPGPLQWPEDQRLPNDMLLTGEDVQQLDLDGLVLFAFGCFTAGTPRLENVTPLRDRTPRELAPQAFSARLVQRLLGRGALAVAGHIERAWDYSFRPEGINDSDITPFSSALLSMLDGTPVGHALETFDRRYLSLNAEVTELYEEYQIGELSADELASPWLACNDARNYVLYGDPAASPFPVGR